MLLLLVPEGLCRCLGLSPPGDPLWVRLSGMFFLDLAFYCIKAAIDENKAFIRWSVTTRPLTILFLGAFVALGYENSNILDFWSHRCLLRRSGRRSHSGRGGRPRSTLGMAPATARTGGCRGGHLAGRSGGLDDGHSIRPEAGASAAAAVARGVRRDSRLLATGRGVTGGRGTW